MNVDMTEVLQSLRKSGMTFREIAFGTGIPASTVHKLVTNGQPLSPGLTKSQKSKDTDKKGKGSDILVHLPFPFSCPGCGREQIHAWFCRECGAFLPVECGEDCSYYEGFSLAEVYEL